MRDVLDYLRDFFSEVGNDPFVKWLSKYLNVILLTVVVIFLGYKGYEMYRSGQEAKRSRYADSLASLQGLFKQAKESTLSEEQRKQFNDLYSNFSNSPEPYQTAATIYMALLLEKEGKIMEAKQTIQAHADRAKSEVWDKLCGIVSARFTVDLSCPSTNGLVGVQSLIDALKLGSDEPLKTVLKNKPELRAILEENLFNTAKKLLKN